MRLPNQLMQRSKRKKSKIKRKTTQTKKNQLIGVMEREREREENGIEKEIWGHFSFLVALT